MTAVVLRRSDFRESSRVVTLLTREHGRITALAKGAHRPDSTFLGRLDFLNEVLASVGADRGGLRLLLHVELVRERRTLRQPSRFLAASHLAHLTDFALPDRSAEPAAFDLLLGGLNLLERCPANAIGHVVLGLELRFLELLGALPDLQACAACGGPLTAGAFQSADAPGLFCRRHSHPPRAAVAPAALDLLRNLQQSPGRQWPTFASTTQVRAVSALPAQWLHRATELHSRLRPLLFARCTP